MKLAGCLTMGVLLSFSGEAQFTHRDFEKLYALEGSWQMPTKKGIRFEQWKKISENVMRAESFRVTGADTVTLEHIELTFNQGEIFYTPTVPDQNEGKPVPFKLSKIEGPVFSFENKAHDFPQRIIYTFKSKTELECVVDGETASGYQKIPFVFRKK